MASIKAELWRGDIIDKGYILRDGKRIYIKKLEPRSDEFKRTLEELSRELRRRLKNLSPLQRKCVKLFYFSQEPTTQNAVAQRLGISRTAVKEHLRRAIRKLKEE